MPKATHASFASNNAEDLNVLHATIALPTSFKSNCVTIYDLGPLLQEELKLREAQLEDLIVAICSQVQLVSAATYRKLQEDQGQDANTRLNIRISSLKTYRDFLAGEYTRVRQIIMDHDDKYETVYPVMNKAAMHRKRTDTGQQVGDSAKVDGFIHSRYRADMGAGPSIDHRSEVSVAAVNVEEDEDDSTDGKAVYHSLCWL
jgi:hypothetical protein